MKKLLPLLLAGALLLGVSACGASLILIKNKKRYKGKH